jgi:hypothetical protein
VSPLVLYPVRAICQSGAIVALCEYCMQIDIAVSQSVIFFPRYCASPKELFFSSKKIFKILDIALVGYTF